MNLKYKITALLLAGGVALSGIDSVSAASYTVKAGDTLSGIGKEYNISYQEIMKMNNLSGTTIHAGQKLEIGAINTIAETKQNTNVYVVKSGDTLSKIGKEFNVSYQDIMELNNLTKTTIYAGQTLKITSDKQLNVSSTAIPVANSYIVKSGDNLSKIAASHGTTHQKIMLWNNLTTTKIYAGQKLFVTEPSFNQVVNVTQAISNSSSLKNSNIVSIANKYLGVKYTFGGASVALGFDCSGLVYQVLKEAGKNIARYNSEGFYKLAAKVTTPQIGDLVFFSNTYKSGISHVGIYVGDGKMISAAGDKVRYDSIHSGYWGKYFTSYGRM